MKLGEHLTVKGMGDILVVEYEDGDYFLKRRDQFWFKGNIWVVVGVSMSVSLTYPSKPLNHFSLTITRAR